jgi:hypothetical protein
LYKDLFNCVNNAGVKKEILPDGNIKFTMENNKKNLFYDNVAFEFIVEKPITQKISN